jgi:hypothetical protein
MMAWSRIAVVSEATGDRPPRVGSQRVRRANSRAQRAGPMTRRRRDRGGLVVGTNRRIHFSAVGWRICDSRVRLIPRDTAELTKVIALPTASGRERGRLKVAAI